jgi:hypothetical protein
MLFCLLVQVMLQLGEGAEGAEVRTRMQVGSLLSDMESFKAANPGAILADFVRWHSPRDWIEGTDDESTVIHGNIVIITVVHIDNVCTILLFSRSPRVT